MLKSHYYILILLRNYTIFLSCFILNEYLLPTMLLLWGASPWMPFSGDRRRFRLGIPSLLAGRMFNCQLKSFLFILCGLTVVANNVSVQFCSSWWFQAGIAHIRAWVYQGKIQPSWGCKFVGLFMVRVSIMLCQCGLTCMNVVLQLDAVLLAQQLRKRFMDQV